MTDTSITRDRFVRQLVIVPGDNQLPHNRRENVTLVRPDGSAITQGMPSVFVVYGDEPRPNTTEGVVWFGGTEQPEYMIEGDLWYSSDGHEHAPTGGFPSTWIWATETSNPGEMWYQPNSAGYQGVRLSYVNNDGVDYTELFRGITAGMAVFCEEPVSGFFLSMSVEIVEDLGGSSVFNFYGHVPDPGVRPANGAVVTVNFVSAPTAPMLTSMTPPTLTMAEVASNTSVVIEGSNFLWNPATGVQVFVSQTGELDSESTTPVYEHTDTTLTVQFIPSSTTPGTYQVRAQNYALDTTAPSPWSNVLTYTITA